jgi:hypothetical protein
MSKFEIANQCKFPSLEDEHCTALVTFEYSISCRLYFFFFFLDVAFWTFNGKYPLEFD